MAYLQRLTAGRLGQARAERLLRTAESVAYWTVGAPLSSLLPASVAYRTACWRGDWSFRHRTGQRSEIVRNLREVLGDELSPEEAERLAREFFRIRWNKRVRRLFWPTPIISCCGQAKRTWQHLAAFIGSWAGGDRS